MTFLVDGTLGGTFPSWTTATRPASPAVGQMGYNTTTGLFDQYVSSGWQSIAAGSSSTNPSVTNYTSGSGTYTTPTGAKYLIVEMVGGGGGGSGGGTGSFGVGGNGGNTTFGSSTAGFGIGGPASWSAGGSGGGTTVSGATTLIAVTGGRGGYTAFIGPTFSGTFQSPGGAGGDSYYGGAGLGGSYVGGGLSAATNTGSGGGGGGSGNDSGQVYTGTGGGAGGFIKMLITTPASTYSYAVGAAGAAGAAGAGVNAAAGGAGGSGNITVTAYF